MKYSKNVLSGLVILSILLLCSGCLEREDESTVAHCSTLKADNALREAETKLEASGIALSFDEPGQLMRPEDLIPDPADLAGEEKQKSFEEVIHQLNIVLDEIEGKTGADAECSVSDRALVHLYLGFVYLFDATSRLLNSDDPAETFVIELDPDAPDHLWYSFDVSPATHAKLDATEDPLEYPLAFTHKERQAIIDAADLIDDAIVKPRAPEIQPRLSSVDRPPYYNYAMWHFERSASLFGQYKPDVQEVLEDFSEQVDVMRSKLQSKSEDWGFTYTLPPWR